MIKEYKSERGSRVGEETMAERGDADKMLWTTKGGMRDAKESRNQGIRGKVWSQRAARQSSAIRLLIASVPIPAL